MFCIALFVYVLCTVLTLLNYLCILFSWYLDASSPTKDKYIDLQDRGGGGDMLDYGGGSGDASGQPGAGGGGAGGGKPKKVIYEVVV